MLSRSDEFIFPFRRFQPSEIWGNGTRHVITFNPNTEKEIYVNIPKLKSGSCFVPDSLYLTFDFKNKNTKP